MASDILIYTTPICPYCYKAKRLLKSKGASFREIDVWTDSSRKQEMVQAAGGRTSVPQIFIDGDHIGGCDELVALDDTGDLDGRLGL